MNIKNSLKKIFHYKEDPIDRWSKSISTIILYISISVLCAAPILSCTYAAIQYINDDAETTGGVGRDISVKEVIETEQLDKDLDVITTEETDEVEIAEETETEVYTESETETETETEIEATSEEVIETVATTTEQNEGYLDVPLSEDLQSYIFELCYEKGIDPDIVIAVIKKESNFDSSIIGDNGRSYGLMQVQPRWHQERMNELGCTDLLNPYDNVTVGIDILADLYMSGNSTEWVLMAYNGGVSYANNNTLNGVVSDYVYIVLQTSKNLNIKR